MTSLKPAQNPPKGAIQLKVNVANRQQIWQEHTSAGKVTLPVKEVLNGQFSAPSIRLNTTNVDGCNSSFEPSQGEAYITVLPMEYSDGEAILDRQGAPEFGAIFYVDTLGYVLEDKKEPEFGEYSELQRYSFHDLERLHCLHSTGQFDTDLSDEIWRRCVAPGEYLELDCDNSTVGKLVCKESDETNDRPLELRRGYSFWGQYGAAVVLSLLTISVCFGLGYVILRRKLAAS
ncbi:MAG: hypothetical protein ABL928_13310 [Sphingorhabdus sp.]